MSGEEGSVSSEGGQVPMKPKNKGGKVNRFEPQNTIEITSSPIILTCFKNMPCFQFFEKVKQVKNNPELTRLFIINLHNKQSSLTGVDF